MTAAPHPGPSTHAPVATGRTDPPAGTRWAGWPPAGWLLLCLAALVEAAAVGFTTVVVTFADSTTCGDAPSPTEVWHGQRDLLVLLTVAALPWAAGLLATPRRGRVTVAGLVAVAPALLALVVGLDPGTWRGSFCF